QIELDDFNMLAGEAKRPPNIQQKQPSLSNNDQYLLIATLLSHYVAVPFTRGYFCTDTSIQYPVKSNTIPTYADVILSVLLPVLWMLITEFAKFFYFRWYPQQPTFYLRLELWGTRKKEIHPFIRNLYILIVIFLFGYLSTWVLTEIAKNFVGELRPHFLALCNSSVTCTCTSNCGSNGQIYITDYVCQNPDATAVREGRRSFFSGHSSSIFYGAAWLIMYIHVAWSWRHLGIIGNVFQTGLAVLASYIAYSRISDFQHHWHDVFTGAIVGALIAFVTFKFILNWRHYNPRFLPYTVISGASPPYSTGNYNNTVQQRQVLSAPAEVYGDHLNNSRLRVVRLT
ncbi:unnamed protein product, partial [Didymodactylos carnosus]